MITLIFAAILFISQPNREPVREEYKMITTIEYFESPGKILSGIISQNGKVNEEIIINNEPGDYLINSTTSNIKKVRADSLKFEPLSSFYSRESSIYDNIGKNDAIITTKINELTGKGWVLTFVTSGVEASTLGFVYTKYYFKREI